MAKENVIADKSLDFAERMIKLYKYLTNTKKEFILAKQVLRSGTSIGAYIAEAQGCQSDADFVAKLHISLKECHETSYWLKLLYRTAYIPQSEFESINADAV